MDNIAHSLVGFSVATAIRPDLVKKHSWKFLLSQALIVNFPDWDILLHLYSKETYYFHHRGFTHSFIGLILIYPICYLIHYLFLKKENCWFLVLFQLLFSHFFLDWLTTYGVMFFYPASMQRYSFPLMFIVDPFLWAISGMSFLAILYALWKDKSILYLRRVSIIGLIFIGQLWFIELGTKYLSENAYFKKVDRVKESRVISYPAPMAPFFWSILEIKQNTYQQGVASILDSKWNKSFGVFKAQDQCFHEAAAASYKLWGSYIDCRPYEHVISKSKIIKGCRCISLKYSFANIDFVTFGAYFIPEGESQGYFLPHRRFNQLLEQSKNLLDSW